MKGAPERILERCSTIYVNGTDLELTDEWTANFQAAYETLGGLGERVLGFCDKHVSFPPDYVFDADAADFPMTELRFVGLISLIDPPRPNVPAAVEKCRQAGIRVAMVTGDHPTTAKAIARIIGLISANSVTQDELDAIRPTLSPAAPLRSVTKHRFCFNISDLRIFFISNTCRLITILITPIVQWSRHTDMVHSIHE